MLQPRRAVARRLYSHRFQKAQNPKTDQVRQRSALPHQHHRAEQRSLTAR